MADLVDLQVLSSNLARPDFPGCGVQKGLRAIQRSEGRGPWCSAWKVGDRWFKPYSGLQVSKKQ